MSMLTSARAGRPSLLAELAVPYILSFSLSLSLSLSLTFSLSPSLYRGGSRLTGFCFGLRAFRGGKEAHRVRFRDESCALRLSSNHS